MSTSTFSPKDYWRAIILYGLNTATYKIALARCLFQFAQAGKTGVLIPELAEAFFDVYQARLEQNRPQLDHPNRQTVMEQVVALYKLGKLSRSDAIDRVAAEAFNDVIPRFHHVYKAPVPTRFYEYSSAGLVLTDAIFTVQAYPEREALLAELNARWDLLEAAFTIRRDQSVLVTDIRALYLANGYERRNITENRPVLNGYQQGRCFYCGEAMPDDAVAVDHVIPRQVLQHDEIWNLVLAHAFCNTQKSDLVPDRHYLEKLIERNEHFIASNHPIKPKLIAQLGTQPDQRRRFVEKVYIDAKHVLGARYTWEGIRGYHPATDPFYKSVIRELHR